MLAPVVLRPSALLAVAVLAVCAPAESAPPEPADGEPTSVAGAEPAPLAELPAAPAAEPSLPGSAGEDAPVPPPTRAELATRVTVFPKGRVLPESMLAQGWAAGTRESDVLAFCVRQRVRCDAFLVELGGAAGEEIVFSSGAVADVFGERGGRWLAIGQLRAVCDNPDWTYSLLGFQPPSEHRFAAMRRGEFAPVAPLYADLEVAGRRLAFIPSPAAACPDQD